MTDRDRNGAGQTLPGLEAIGWRLETPFAGDMLPTLQRQHNLVVVAPPAAVYAAPALAALCRPDRAGPNSLVLCPHALLDEFTALAWELGAAAVGDAEGESRFGIAFGPAQGVRHLAEGPPPVLVTTPGIARTLQGAARLKLDRFHTVVLAWPEAWEADTTLHELLSDLAPKTQRVIYTADTQAAGSIIERYAWRALTLGMPPAGESPSLPAIRSAVTAFSRRGEALRDVLHLLDPTAVWVWSALGSDEDRILAAVGGCGPEVRVGAEALTTGLDLVVAYDLPTPERLATLARSGPVVVLTTALGEAYLEGLGVERRPLRLPGELERVEGETAEQRAVIAATLRDRPLRGEILALAPLFQRFEPARVAAALYHLWAGAGVGAGSTSEPAAAGARSPGAAAAKMFVSAGKRDGVTVADLVGMLINEIGVDREAIGRIELKDAFSLVELPASRIDAVISAVDGRVIRRRRIRAKRDRGGRARPRPAP